MNNLHTEAGLIADLNKRIAELEAAVAAVSNLIDNSTGVVGLHLNDNIAYWESLLKGGRQEEWLQALSVVLKQGESMLSITDVLEELLPGHLSKLSDEQADSLLVELAKDEMVKKLRKKREDGKGGWFGPTVTNEDLKVMLAEHVEKGDPVDVLNLAAMILARTKFYGSCA